MRPTTVFTLDPQAGQHLAIAGDNYRTVISGKETEGALAVIDMFIPPNGGPGPHAHTAFQESFYIIEGEIVVRSETQTYIAKKGAFVSVPRGGAIHSFKNESTSVAHILCIVAGAGLEHFFEEAGTPVHGNEFLPSEMNEDGIAKMKNLAVKYEMELFPPDYLDKKKSF